MYRDMWRDRMRTAPLGPSVELPKGREVCEGCAEMGGGTACELRHWDHRWSSIRATKRAGGDPNSVPRTHANAATGAFGGAP